MQRHRIGTYAGGVAGMKSICDLLQIGIDPQSSFYAEIVGSDLNGAPIEAGFPTATWAWEQMHQGDFNRLLAFIGATGSAAVYIRTRNNSGASGFDFTDYTAIMHRPQAASRVGLELSEITIEFVGLEAV